ncbi:TPA: restriction endonuclease subunit S [Enterobacter chuandaensis]|uniref:restriction endonuclease subunit S n=1 Tax=Enterobacter nematophilus TaxID=2994648 RepID=UPI0032F77882|nr:restriction endonuclease subunit S [Enterobacter chuandaensis]
MSVLSYLEKLLNGVDIQWKTIGEVTLRTSNIKWREATRSYRYVDLTSVDIETKKITETTEVTANNAPSRAQKLIEENDVIFATTRPTQQRFCLIDGEYSDEVASTGFCVLRAKQDEVLPKWIWHWISTSYFKKYVEENQSGSAYPAISDAKVKECYIPVPCPENPEKSLAIQSEIVRILDKFTALTAELTAELNMRKKQYNYYRDQLLSFEDGEVEWKTLEEVLVDKFWIMPATPKFDDNGEIPYVTSKNISGGNIDFERVKHISRDDFLSISKNRPILKGDFLISMIGTIGEIARVKCLDPDFYGQNMYLIRLNEELLHPRYFLHFFDSPRMKFYFKSVKNNSGQGYLKANNIDGLSIPLPSIDEQQKIAFILDKFDTLTNPINEGLPREIELRQKQYEYYRDLLFSFPKPDTVNQ